MLYIISIFVLPVLQCADTSLDLAQRSAEGYAKAFKWGVTCASVIADITKDGRKC